jgi:hypothetical protein
MTEPGGAGRPIVRTGSYDGQVAATELFELVSSLEDDL